MRRHTLALGAAAICASAALFAQSQTPKTDPQPQQRPTFKSEANFIRVDAFVTQDGKPVENLRVEDFELLEDGVRQRVETFEHVRIRPAGPQAARIEPNSQRDADQMAADPRSRVFVLFLDVDHVPLEGSYRLKTALVGMLSQLVGPDDFIGIITSRNSPSELILGRKTALIEEQLEKYWYWGTRDTPLEVPDEEMYRQCFYQFAGGTEVAEEMIDRRREKLTLDALADLTIHLRGIREERKAVLVVTTGWPLYRENQHLARPLYQPGDRTRSAPQMPGPPPVVFGPGGRLALGDDPRNPAAMTMCERHRWELAHRDDWQAFRDLVQDANRANVSFYPIDPRGLVVFDSPIGPRRPLSPAQDRNMLRARESTLRNMAEETDGLAVVNTTDLSAGLRRVAADLSSYYLLGYYASSDALDGKYHRISVRVKRPGLQVRARKGYRAARREEIANAAAAAAPAAPEAASAMQSAVTTALNRLALIRPDTALYVHAIHARGGPLWIAGEVPGPLARTPAWARGAKVSIMALDAAGNTVGVARETIAAGERGFLVSLPLDDGATTPARVQVRAEPDGAAPVGLEVAPEAGEPMLLRSSGAQPRAAADFRFFRTEDLLYRWPLQAGESVGGARVLDRNGGALPLTPTVAEERVDAMICMAGALKLSALVNGDYLLELTKTGASREIRTLVPFRIVR